MRRMFYWLREKKLEQDRRREIRAMLKSFHIVMEQSNVMGGEEECPILKF